MVSKNNNELTELIKYLYNRYNLLSWMITAVQFQSIDGILLQ